MRLFGEAAEAAEADGDTDRAAAAYARSVEIGARMHGIAGDPPVAELKVMLERGHELASDDDLVTRARLRLDDAWLAWMSKDPVAMAIPAEEGLELARRTDDRQLVQNALDAITASEWLQGRQLDAVEHTRERLDLLESAPRSHALDVEISDALHMMVLCLVQVGEFREALMYAKRGAEVDRSRGVEMAEYQRELHAELLAGQLGPGHRARQKRAEGMGRVRAAADGRLRDPRRLHRGSLRLPRGRGGRGGLDEPRLQPELQGPGADNAEW